MRWLDGITDVMDMSLSKLWAMVKERDAWHATVQGSQRVGHDLVTEEQHCYHHFPCEPPFQFSSVQSLSHL